MSWEPGACSQYSDWLWPGWSQGQSLSPSGVSIFSSLHVIQNGSGAYSASYPTDMEDSFRGAIADGHETDRSPPTSAKVKNT
jgi:hypothetical protein